MTQKPIALGTLLSVALCQAACASAPPLPTPEHEKLAAPALTHLQVRFEAGEGVSPIALPCGDTELPDNGLDDDCDGRVDAEPAHGPYLALARTAETALEIELWNDEGKAVGRLVTAGAEACAAEPRTEAFQLEEGRYTLVAKRPVGCKVSQRDALGISVGPEREVFAVSGFTEAPRTLGAVVVRAVPDDH